MKKKGIGMAVQVSAQDVKKLRDMTHCGMMDCKEALIAAGGDFEKAKEILRAKGLSRADSRSGRAAVEGYVGSYIHMHGRIGVLLELNSETDFVARSDDFRQLHKDLCLQICATNPVAVSREGVPSQIVEAEKRIAREQVAGKPENIVDKIVQGKLEKFYEETVLLEQKFVKDDALKVMDLVKQVAGKFGENIVVKRFARFELGGE